MKSYINEEIKRKIGYEYIVEQLVILSPYGKERLNKLAPFTSKEELAKEYSLIDFFIKHLHSLKRLEIILSKFKNILSTICRCEKGYILNIIELYEVKMQVINIEQLRKECTSFKKSYLNLQDCSNIISLLSDSDNITYDFYLYDSYSEKLRNYRKEKRKIEKQIQLALNEEKAKLQIKRAKYVSLEETEENKVKSYLSQEIKKILPILKYNINIIGHIDLLIAKAKLIEKYKAIKPIMSEDRLLIKGMQNPLVRKQVEDKNLIYAKNDIELKSGTTILTGANMSGKSSVLKTIALNVYLAQVGFYVFADLAEIPLVKGIKYLGNEASDIHGYSTFAQEIVNLNETINEIKKDRLLICVDEFARTTNPYEGEKFVKTLAKFTQNYSSLTIIATHYDGVADRKMQHYQIKGIKDFDDLKHEDVLKNFNHYMDYSLKKVKHDIMVPQEAYKVATLLNIDKEFKQILDSCYEE